MINILKKYKVAAAVIIYIIGLFSIFFFIMFPVIQKIKSQSDQIQEKIIDNDLEKEKISKIPEMQKIEAAYNEKEKKLNILLTPEEKVDFIKNLENLADETGNKISMKVDENASKTLAKAKKDPADIKGTLPYDSYMAVQVNMEGSYESFLNFVSKLENLEKYVNMTAFALSKNKANGNSETSGSDIFSPDKNAPVKNSNSYVVDSIIDIIVYIKKQ